MAAHVKANLYNKRVKTTNSPIMNQYTRVVFTHAGGDEKLTI